LFFFFEELKSTKSWVRPKHGKFDDSIYSDVMPEPANHEFESYTKSNYNFSNNGSENYMDYGFKVAIPPFRLNSQTSLNKMDYNNTYLEASSSNNQNIESYKYFKIIQKLTQSTFNNPANLPILCNQPFNSTNPLWSFFANQLNATNTSKENSHLFKLISLSKGEPINAMFYLSDLDLIYVKTADDLAGFVPRNYCKLFSQNETIFNEYLKPELATMIQNINNNQHNESIKYHSLSSSEYDDLNEEHIYSNIPVKQQHFNPQTFLKPNESIINNELNENKDRRFSNLYQTSDSGYRSKGAENILLVNDYEEGCIIDKFEVSPEKINQRLLSMQSRSRLPISISSNLNLELIGDKQFENFTYKTSPNNNKRLSMLITPKSNKNTRRSLDPCLSANNNKLYYRKTTFEMNLNDLDVNKIELDSISEVFEKNLSTVKKQLYVIAKHVAKSHQEISVEPGNVVLVIREHNDWLYIKLIEDDKTNLNKIQKYGFIPQSVTIDLELIVDQKKNRRTTMHTQL